MVFPLNFILISVFDIILILIARWILFSKYSIVIGTFDFDSYKHLILISSDSYIRFPLYFKEFNTLRLIIKDCPRPKKLNSDFFLVNYSKWCLRLLQHFLQFHSLWHPCLCYNKKEGTKWKPDVVPFSRKSYISIGALEGQIWRPKLNLEEKFAALPCTVKTK